MAAWARFDHATARVVAEEEVLLLTALVQGLHDYAPVAQGVPAVSSKQQAPAAALQVEASSAV